MEVNLCPFLLREKIFPSEHVFRDSFVVKYVTMSHVLVSCLSFTLLIMVYPEYSHSKYTSGRSPPPQPRCLLSQRRTYVLERGMTRRDVIQRKPFVNGSRRKFFTEKKVSLYWSFATEERKSACLLLEVYLDRLLADKNSFYSTLYSPKLLG